MNRTFKFRISPTVKQHNLLNEMLADHCDLYNAALQERRDAYKNTGKSPSLYDQFGQIKDIREDTQYSRWSSQVAQHTIRTLDKAFSAFFSRIKKGQTPGYPRFKPKSRFNTVTLTYGNGSKLHEETSRVYLKGIGHIKVKLHRQVQGTIKQVSVTRSSKKWFVNFICADVPKREHKPTGAIVGIDKGITHLLATSDGDFVENPKHFAKHRDSLKSAQQDLARKKRGSNRRKKAVQRVARIHEKIRNSRQDHHHKLSRHLVDTYDTIVLEDLRVSNMSKSAKGTVESPGKNVKAKSGLNRSIQDAGWTTLQEFIKYKAEEAGTEMILVNPANTSRMCFKCNHIDKGNRIQEVFKCLSCGHTDHADTNAARNILRLGISLHKELSE